MSLRRTTRRVEVPTLLLGLAIYTAFFSLTYSFNSLPLLLAIPMAAFVIAWHSSLQHEASHGHPTRWPLFNTLFAGLSLWLYLPFPLYREGHMDHHNSPHLTSPLDDTESYFFTEAQWQAMSKPTRTFWWAHNTLLGRFVLGPAVILWRVYSEEFRRIAKGDMKRLGLWGIHALVVAAILTWTTQVCGIAVWEYLAFFVYPGMSLALLRSYAEHQPADTQDERIAIVEAHPIWGLLFLHNNLHVLHHAHPGLPWYQYQARYRQERDELVRANGGLVYRGYGEVFRRFFLRALQAPVHPTVKGAGPAPLSQAMEPVA